jgi:oligopeptide/dipeptide ABC transporter ATP-binding protein
MTSGTSPLLKVSNLVKHFGQHGAVRAVDGVDLTVGRAETIGIVGESGCGKSTLGKTILRIFEPTSGNIAFDADGKGLAEITGTTGEELKRLRRQMSIVFQDPYSSLNPRKTVRFSVGEPLMLAGLASGKEIDRRVGELLEAVGLPARYMERFPHAFSGGQRQRIALARALALNPRLIVADESVSALDVSVQAQIVNLFLDLQRRLSIAFLFISHDLKIVRHVSDRIVVMYLGKVVEEGPPDALCSQPLHPYTEALLSAVPQTAETAPRQRIILQGDPPSPVNPPNGCRFRTRCRHANDMCAAVEPVLRPVAGRSGRVACHHAETLSLFGIAPSGPRRPIIEELTDAV